jgi:hypothetical protein
MRKEEQINKAIQWMGATCSPLANIPHVGRIFSPHWQGRDLTWFIASTWPSVASAQKVAWICRCWPSFWRCLFVHIACSESSELAETKLIRLLFVCSEFQNSEDANCSWPVSSYLRDYFRNTKIKNILYKMSSSWYRTQLRQLNPSW